MRYSVLFLLLSVGPLFFSRPLLAQPVSYDDVLLMINDRSVNSVDIGNYFAQRRNIPAVNIFHFSHDTSASTDQGETIDSATYKKEIQWPLENYMLTNNLVSTINYIVCTKGCPLRITAPNSNAVDANNNPYIWNSLSSFTDCLMLINGKDSNDILINKPAPIFSPYCFEYNPRRHFVHDQNSMPIYLVTRLDGYTVDQVKSLIRRAQRPAHVGQGVFVMDIDSTKYSSGFKKGNNWMTWARDSLATQSLPTILDSTNLFLTNQSNVIGYCSWGSNDANSNATSTNAIPHNTYVNGAIAETFVSTAGRSFNPGTVYGQSLIADLIVEGITGVKGYTDEPLLDVMAQPQWLFTSFTEGYNLAESFWGASEWISWRQVVIGDPKMMLLPRVPVVASTDTEDFGSWDKYRIVSIPIKLYNTSTLPIQFNRPGVVGGDTACFGAVSGGPASTILAPGDSLAATVGLLGKTYGHLSSIARFPFVVEGNLGNPYVDVVLEAEIVRPALTVVSPSIVVSNDTVYSMDATVNDSVSDTFILHNTSTHDTITITSLLIAGSTEFELRSADPSVASPTVIANSSSTVVQFVFTPVDTGIRTATLRIVSNANEIESPRILHIQGRGLPAVGINEHVEAPQSAFLSNAYPNPFSNATAFTVRVTNPQRASLKIFDVMGRVVDDLTPQLKLSGGNVATMNAGSLPNGVYVCRLSDGGMAISRTVVVAR